MKPVVSILSFLNSGPLLLFLSSFHTLHPPCLIKAVISHDIGFVQNQTHFLKSDYITLLKTCSKFLKNSLQLEKLARFIKSMQFQSLIVVTDVQNK